jgi:hypothetical protein
MGITVKESLLHWNYFLALETDLQNVSRYIEFKENNFKTYSIELAHLLLASASEVDVVMKEACRLLDPSKNPRNINDYREIITRCMPQVKREVVYIPRFGLSFKPWTNWTKAKNPFWWGSYNNVKHQRNNHFEEANLKNVLNAMGGLLITVFYYYELKFSQTDPNAFQRYSETMSLLQPQSEFMRLNEGYYPSYRVTRGRL